MSQAVKKVKNSIKQQQKENLDWFNQRYNEDATQRADAQALLTRTEENIRNRNAQAAATQAVMGGTEESVAAAKAANNQALADATTNIAVNADKRNDAIESQYMATKSALTDKMNDMTMQGAKNTSDAMNAATDTFEEVGGGI